MTSPSASYRRPPLGQKSQQSEQPVHIFTSFGRSSTPMPSESDGQAAMQTPHCTQRPASITARSNSQNQTLPGASSMLFISSRTAKAAVIAPPGIPWLDYHLGSCFPPLPAHWERGVGG